MGILMLLLSVAVVYGFVGAVLGFFMTLDVALATHEVNRWGTWVFKLPLIFLFIVVAWPIVLMHWD